MAKGLDRAMEQLEKVFDSLDSPRPDHDTIRDRIAAAMAMAQVIRAKAFEETMRLKLQKQIELMDSGVPGSG